MEARGIMAGSHKVKAASVDMSAKCQCSLDGRTSAPLRGGRTCQLSGSKTYRPHWNLKGWESEMYLTLGKADGSQTEPLPQMQHH